VLRAMRRSYRSSKFLGILDRVREAMPDASITTDIIVGFPGETEEDFLETMRVVEESRFTSAFTFQYSPRPGTPAFDREPLPKDVVQERFERLLALQDEISLQDAQAQVGREVELLVLDGGGRKGKGDGERLSGREPGNRLVHFGVPEGAALDGRGVPRPGDMVTVRITHGAPYHLIADGPGAASAYAVRRTRAGDAWDTASNPDHAHDACGTTESGGPVGLGLPQVRVTTA
ncbi:MAG TPA: radical SAM protein, partial [Demequina sp.]|nr:radical SAM protein [Demequina sp.]